MTIFVHKAFSILFRQFLQENPHSGRVFLGHSDDSSHDLGKLAMQVPAHFIVTQRKDHGLWDQINSYSNTSFDID